MRLRAIVHEPPGSLPAPQSLVNVREHVSLVDCGRHTAIDDYQRGLVVMPNRSPNHQPDVRALLKASRGGGLALTNPLAPIRILVVGDPAFVAENDILAGEFFLLNPLGEGEASLILRRIVVDNTWPYAGVYPHSAEVSGDRR